MSVREHLLIMTSELVTNSVRSGASQIDVDIEILPAVLTLSVADDGAGWPVLAEDANDSATGGRGLAIVELLADRWDVEPWDGGKRVITQQGLSSPRPD
jgi:two-component sensor histidine kinase